MQLRPKILIFVNKNTELMGKNTQNTSAETEVVQRKIKKVRNRSGHRVELVIENKVVVFMPGKVVEVPFDFNIPNDLGLYVR